uniref:NADH dehydrogenase subunit 2 n=1 Tax=Labyrinthula sp. TaxID=1678526 RepID=A0A7S6U9S2_9STRA|nr:NADH dehydrogenase subunit 2 [Labyrinthula sp.]
MYEKGEIREVLLPEVYMGLVITGLMLYGSVYTRTMRRGDEGGDNKGLVWLGVWGMWMGSILNWGNEFGEGEVLGGSLVHNSMTGGLKGIVWVFGGLCLVGGLGELGRYRERGGEEGERVGRIPEREISQGYRLEYVLLVMLSTYGVGLMGSGGDMMWVYLALELQALGMYVMAGSGREGKAYGTEGGLKYYVMGAIGSGLMLYGVSLMYGSTGTTNIREWRECNVGGYEGGGKFEVGLMLVVVGMLFKLGGAPFHMWVGDVYEGASKITGLYFGVVPKIGVLGVLLKLSTVIPEGEGVWRKWIISVGLLSIGVSLMGALYQRRIKRFIGYSSIGHVGYMLIGLGSGTIEGVMGMWVYVILYMVTGMCMWQIVSKMRGKGGGGIVNIEEMGGMGRRGKWEGVTLGVCMLSVAGIPPMAGFYGKMYIFMGAVEGSMGGVALWGILGSVVSTYYYLRVIKVMYFEEGGEEERGRYRGEELVYRGEGMSRGAGLVMGVCVIVMVLFMMEPGVLLVMGHNMSLGMTGY